jgi:hypothetical protein
MNQSQEIGDLAKALSKAQATINKAKKSSDNPFFKSKYADLSEVWDACREQLTANDLAVIQATDECDDGVIVVTRLVHSSGQWIEGRLKMKPVKNDPQGIGSCISYARRYALAAMVGVCTEDDDAQAACTPQSPKKPQSINSKHPVTQNEDLQAGDPNSSVNIGLKRQIREIVNKNNISWPQVTVITGIPNILQSNNTSDLTEVLDKLKIQTREQQGA